ncbi:MAG TPA: hypothetical protein VIV40_16750 [Kofleriaceae bacterium]
MRRSLVLVSVLVLLVVGGIYLFRDDAAPAQPAEPTGPSSAAATSPRGTSQPAIATAEPVRAPAAAEQAGAVEWKNVEPAARTYVQREDDSVPWPKDAPPPLFSKATLQAIRAAVTPGVNQCMATTRARYPELATNPELSAEITIDYTARATHGAITIAGADVAVQGFPDDALASCVKDVYRRAHVTANDQADGTGKVHAGFSLDK